MLHTYRFMGQIIKDDIWHITGDEHYHLTKVLRLTKANLIEITDGQGNLATANITEITKNHVACLALSQIFKTMPQPQIHACLGFLDLKSVDSCLPQLVSLGVSSVRLFADQHTAKHFLVPTQLRRWQTMALTAIKQSKQVWLPEIFLYPALQDCVMAINYCPLKLLFDLDSSIPYENNRTINHEAIALLVGCERGFSTEDVELCHKHNFQRVALKLPVLRSSLAIVLAVGMVAHNNFT